MTPDTPQKLEIDWLKTAGGVFAAVSSAFLLSTLGAAGTIVGAALGSVILTVGSALYSQGLARSQQRLARVQTAAMRKLGVAQADVRRAARRQAGGEAASDAVDAHLAHADERLDDVKDDLGAVTDEPTGPGWRERLVVLPWKRIALISAGLFVATVLAITAFELVAGRSVSSITGGTEGSGGTTIGRIGGGSDEDSPKEDDKVPPDNQSSPSDAPSDEPAPTNVPTGEPTSAPESATPAPTPSETVSPSDPAATSPTG